MSNFQAAIQAAITSLTVWRAAFSPLIAAFPLSDEQAKRVARIDEALGATIAGRDGLDTLLTVMEGANLFKIAAEKLLNLSLEQQSAQQEVQSAWRAGYHLWRDAA